MASISAGSPGCGGASRAKAATSAGDAIAAHSDGAAITVWAVPGSRHTGITGMYGDAVRVRVGAKPEQGRANAAIGGVLGAATGAGIVELVSGRASRRKLFVAVGITRAAAVRAIERAMREHERDRLR